MNIDALVAELKEESRELAKLICQNLLMTGAVTLREAKDLWLLRWSRNDQSFFSRDCGIRMTFRGQSVSRQREPGCIIPFARRG